MPEDALQKFVLKDLKSAAPRTSVSGDFATFTGFNSPSDPSNFRRIDFVFGGSNGKWCVSSDRRSVTVHTDDVNYDRTVDSYRVETALTDDGILASDHRPVFADITI